MTADLLTEAVPRMPPLSMKIIEKIGQDILNLLAPEALASPIAINLADIVEKKLPQYGIFVYPATFAELKDSMAATIPVGERETNILLSAALWEQLFESGRRANRARATVAHELSHAILHVPYLRQRKTFLAVEGDSVLHRVRRDELRPYEDPEWQAWGLAGCILAPRCTIETLADRPPSILAEIYEVSEGMVVSHLKRLKLLSREGGMK